MPMTDQNKSGCPMSAEPAGTRVAQDERLASAVSAYLDGELKGEELAEFETLLRNDEVLSREVAGMRRIGQQLTALGADILDEPIPDTMLEALARLESD
jgi:anti-sigma factor RsiW